MIKKGSKIKVRNNMWAVLVKDNEFKPGNPGKHSGQETPTFKVIETGLKLPTDHQLKSGEIHVDANGESAFNDTIIQNPENKEIYFVFSKHVKEVKEVKEVKNPVLDKIEELQELIKYKNDFTYNNRSREIYKEIYCLMGVAKDLMRSVK